MAASALLPMSVAAQRAGGEIGVSLTILPPMVQPAVFAGMRIERDGSASMATATPTTTRRAHVVTTQVSSDRRDPEGARHAPASSRVEGRAGCATHEIEQVVDADSDSPEGTVRVARFRAEYFVVSGT